MAKRNSLEPGNAPLRNPTSNQKANGRIMNPPRYPDFGGFNDASAIRKNDLDVKKPGGEK